MTEHTQCLLTRKDEDGERRAMTWLPSQYAVEGRPVSVKHPVSGAWHTYRVEQVFASEASTSRISASRAHRGVRDAGRYELCEPPLDGSVNYGR
jgi:hypothetical protein